VDREDTPNQQWLGRNHRVPPLSDSASPINGCETMEAEGQFDIDKANADTHEMEVAKRLYEATPEIESQKWCLTDVRRIEEYRRKDIDFVVSDGSEYDRTPFLNIEVKIDRTKLPNFFIEIGRENGNKGWIKTTESDELWFYFVEQNKLYRFNTKKLKEYSDSVIKEIGVIQYDKEHEKGLNPEQVAKLSWYKPATAKTNSIGLAIPQEIVIKALSPKINDYKVTR